MTSTSGFQPVRALSVSALAAEGVRERIVSGQLRPGERLREETLAEALGVSRPPLREALQLLAQEGLVRLVPRRGAVVASLTVQDAYEIVTLRRSLENLALDLAVPVGDPTALVGLEKALGVMEEHAAQERQDSAVDDSMAFHLALVDLAGHELLSDTYRRLSSRVRMCMNLNRRIRAADESLTTRAARHRRILDAVRDGDHPAVRGALHDDAALSFVAALATSLPQASEAARAWYDEVVGRH